MTVGAEGEGAEGEKGGGREREGKGERVGSEREVGRDPAARETRQAQGAGGRDGGWGRVG